MHPHRVVVLCHRCFIRGGDSVGNTGVYVRPVHDGVYTGFLYKEVIYPGHNLDSTG